MVVGMTLQNPPTWEYAQLALEREPKPGGDWPIRAFLHLELQGAVEITYTDTVALINDLGRQGWELLGPPEVVNVAAVHTDSGGLHRQRAYWVERRFWLKRNR
jgi:hypothetical protein